MYTNILDLFEDTTSMIISETKSSFLEFEVEVDTLTQIGHFVPFHIVSLKKCMKYLGFF